MLDLRKRVRHDLNRDNDPYRRHEWLPPRCDELLWRLELNEVDNPLDFSALWDTNGSSRCNIREASSRDRGKRLYRALKDHRRWMHKKSSTGRWERRGYCFTDVILCIPSTAWEQEMKHRGGEGIYVVADELASRHQTDLAPHLPDNRPPRYLVRPDSKLDKTVVFLFGTAVYLPDPDAQPAFDLLPSVDKEPKVLLALEPIRHRTHPPSFYAGSQPPGFYADQECLLLTPEGCGPVPVLGWSAPEDVYLLLRRTGEDDWKPFGSSGRSDWEPKFHHEGERWCFELRGTRADSTKQVLSLEVAPRRLSGSPPYGDAGCTLIPGLPSLVSPYTLELEAILLPKLSLYRDLRQWTIWLDQDGKLASPARLTEGQSGLFRLQLLNDQELSLCIPEQEAQTLKVPISAPVDIDGTGMRLLPLPSSHGHGLLQLACTDLYPLDTKLLVGRTDPTSEMTSPDIALDQLAQPEGLLWSTQSHPGFTLCNLSLSRNHAQVWVEEDHLLAEPCRKDCLLMHLDEGYKPLPSTGGLRLRLAPGECLLAGNYLLRFRS